MRRVRLQWVMPCLVLVVLALTGAADAQTCEPAWQQGFGAVPGFDRPVRAFASFDDGSGSGSQLYAGGGFVSYDGVEGFHGLARWDGATWHSVGAPLTGTSAVKVLALAVFDDGSGEALYVGGTFSTAGGLATGRLARWDGTDWSVVGTTNSIGGPVHALEVFDDGSGPALFVGGRFTQVAGQPASGLARWDGSTWSTVDGGVDFDFPAAAQPEVRALKGFDDGSGPKLYAAGYFTTAGGVSARSIARWDGTTWDSVGPGLGSATSLGAGGCLEVYDDGGGPALYVGGNFREIQGIGEVRSIAKWNGLGGGGYSKLGVGLSLGGIQDPDDLVASDMVVHQGRLWVTGMLSQAGGFFAPRLSSWDGSSWSGPSSGLTGGLFANGPEGSALAVFDDGSGERLFVGGDFEAAGGTVTHHIATYTVADGFASLSPPHLEGRVLALAEFDDGGGPVLYAGGEFTHLGDTPLGGIARFVDGAWEPVGGGFEWNQGAAVVRALTVFDDGSGAALYAGGSFTVAGGVSAPYVARWNGVQWSALPGTPLSDSVHCLRVLDLGLGSQLFAGGAFKTPARHVARWTGQSWRDIGGGVFDDDGGVPVVYDVAAYDDGRGEGAVLYVTGSFQKAGVGAGIPAQNIARWNGLEWSAVGELGEVSPLGSDRGLAFAVFDDGKGFGTELFVAGRFREVDGVDADRIAKWNGVRWAPLGAGLDGSGEALAVHDDGTGPALFVGGSFDVTGMQDALHVARWDGTWSSRRRPGSTSATASGTAPTRRRCWSARAACCPARRARSSSRRPSPSRRRCCSVPWRARRSRSRAARSCRSPRC